MSSASSSSKKRKVLPPVEDYLGEEDKFDAPNTRKKIKTESTEDIPSDSMEESASDTSRSSSDNDQIIDFLDSVPKRDIKETPEVEMEEVQATPAAPAMDEVMDDLEEEEVPEGKPPSKEKSPQKPSKKKKKKKGKVKEVEESEVDEVEKVVITPLRSKTKAKPPVPSKTKTSEAGPSNAPLAISSSEEDPSEEPPNFKTPTGKGKQPEKGPAFPSWLINPEEKVEKEKVAWEWATGNVPPSGYDIVDVMGKATRRNDSFKAMGKFLLEHLPNPEEKDSAVWAAPLLTQKNEKQAIVEEAIKELMENEDIGFAHIQESVWSLVYSKTGDRIAHTLLKGKAMIHREQRRAIVFRPITFLNVRNLRIKEVSNQ